MLAQYTSTHSYYLSPCLDPSPAGSYPEWDEGFAGTEEAAGDEGVGYAEQGEVDALFDSWDEQIAGGTQQASAGELYPPFVIKYLYSESQSCVATVVIKNSFYLIVLLC